MGFTQSATSNVTVYSHALDAVTSAAWHAGCLLKHGASELGTTWLAVDSLICGGLLTASAITAYQATKHVTKERSFRKGVAFGAAACLTFIAAGLKMCHTWMPLITSGREYRFVSKGSCVGVPQIKQLYYVFRNDTYCNAYNECKGQVVRLGGHPFAYEANCINRTYSQFLSD